MSNRLYRLNLTARQQGLDGRKPSIVPVVRVSRAQFAGGGERYAVCQTNPTLSLFDLGGESRAVTLVIAEDIVGTLCARDGIKTGPGCPNGQDAWDGKLIVEARILA